MDTATRNLVRQRSGARCEYCHLPEEATEVPFHVEHIVPKQHRGSDDPSNLALACDRCNLHKGPNLTSIDPDTNETVSLFHPRHDAWSDHFQWQGVLILGITPTGRATVELLNMNVRHRLQFRKQLQASGDWSPS